MNFTLAPPLAFMFATEGWGHERTGRLHAGFDLRAAVGTPALAAHAGTVVYAGPYSDTTGLTVELDRGDGLMTRYLHLSSLAVTKGQRVATGAVLGRTGHATSPHLHFDCWVLPQHLPLYAVRHGTPKGGFAFKQTFRGVQWVKVPMEPIVPSTYQADVLSKAQEFGLAPFKGGLAGKKSILVLAALLGGAGFLGYRFYKTLPA